MSTISLDRAENIIRDWCWKNLASINKDCIYRIVDELRKAVKEEDRVRQLAKLFDDTSNELFPDSYMSWDEQDEEQQAESVEATRVFLERSGLK